jgi:hypothetical protein
MLQNMRYADTLLPPLAELRTNFIVREHMSSEPTASDFARTGFRLLLAGSALVVAWVAGRNMDYPRMAFVGGVGLLLLVVGLILRGVAWYLRRRPDSLR